MLETINQSSFHIEELSALQFGWQIDFTQLGPAQRKSSVSLLQSANLGVCHFQFNSGFDQRLHARPGFYSFGVPDPDTRGATVQGNSATPGALVVFPHDDAAHGVSPAGFHGYGIHIRAAFLEAIAETVFRMPLRLLVPASGVYPQTGVQFGILSWELAKWQQMAVIDNPASVPLLEYREEALAIAVLNGLGNSIASGEKPCLKSERAIRLVLDYLNTNPSNEVTAAELCALADCSQRWLEQSFKTRFGVTPKQYVKCLRMARLRRDLLFSSGPESQAINELAGVHGFWHMGQLAADYRKMYGELPSDTLKGSCGNFRY